VLSAISQGQTWYRGLPAGDQRGLAEAFGFSFRVKGPRELPYAYMSNGRQSYFWLNRCSGCTSEYEVAIGFYGKQPARYIGTIQGIARRAS
jgi:hypothetical protein